MKTYYPIIKKELKDASRDRGSLAVAFLMPIFFAAILFGSISFIATMMNQANRSEITLPVDGKHLIAPLVERLEEADIRVVDPPNEPEQAIRNQLVDMVLVVPNDIDEHFRAQKSVTLTLLSDHSRTESQGKISRVRSAIERWSRSTGALRLMARNVSPEIANPITIDSVNVTSDQRLASRVLNGLPLLILTIIFTAGTGMTSDMASGERERRSLEPLLINPVSHGDVFIGKWLATVIMISIVMVIGIAFQFIGINLAPVESLGLRLEMGIDKYLLILFIVAPVALMAAALQLFVSFFAKSLKDAQLYHSFLIILPMLPGFYLIFNAGSAELWQMFVPIMGPIALVIDIISGDGANLLYSLIASATSIVFAIVFVCAGIFLLKQEKTVFG
ncbi:MAG: ABC transporter permease [Pseudomonadota bacterium]